MNNSLLGRPNYSDAPVYAAYYFDLTDCWEDLDVALRESTDRLFRFLHSIPVDQQDFKYQPEKWSVKQVVLHMMDTERIFQYRAFRFSRQDATELHGFDEDQYIANSNSENRNLTQIIEEFETVRKSTLLLFSGMSDEMLDFRGHANGSVVTTRSVGWMIIGHAMHHKAFLKEKYLKLSA